MKKLIIMLTSLILIVLCIASCNGTGADTTTPDTGSDVPDEPATLKFSEDGKCEFYIVCAEGADGEIKELALNLRNHIKKYTGADIKVVTDLINDNPVGDTGIEHQYEILIGKTNRAESVAAHENLRSRDYSLTFSGGKIVLAGTTVNTIEKACNRFVDSVMVKQSKGNLGRATIVLTEEDRFEYKYSKYTIGTCTVLGRSLSDYKIVYDNKDVYSAERNARLFARELANKAGYALDVGSRSTEGVPEIRFGVSDISPLTKPHSYSVKAADGKLLVSANCMEGYSAAFTYLTETLFKGDKVEIADGFSYEGVADVSDSPLIDSRKGEYRVIFNNIYGNHRTEHPIITRNDMNAELHLEYLPDVIGIQEGSEHTSSYMTFMKMHGYAVVDVVANNSNKHNYTPLLYLADKFDVIDKGYHLYDDGAGDKSKSVTWAVFKDKQTGDVFAVAGTHFYWTSDELGQAARLKDAEQISEIVQNIATKHGCAVIVGGDLNCRVTAAPFGILNTNGFKNLQKISPETMDITTHHAYAEFDEEAGMYLVGTVPTNPYSTAIDHALVYNESKMTPKLFHVITHDYSLLSSDHCPVMVEFDVN